MLKVTIFLCLWIIKLLLLVLLLSEGAQVVTSVATGVTTGVATSVDGGSLCCYISANQ